MTSKTSFQRDFALIWDRLIIPDDRTITIRYTHRWSWNDVLKYRIFLDFPRCDHQQIDTPPPTSSSLTQHPSLQHIIMPTAGLRTPADTLWDIASSVSECFKHYKDPFFQHKHPGCLMQGSNVNDEALDGTMIVTHRLGPGWPGSGGFCSCVSSSSEGKLKPSVCGDGGFQQGRTNCPWW